MRYFGHLLAFMGVWLLDIRIAFLGVRKVTFTSINLRIHYSKMNVVLGTCDGVSGTVVVACQNLNPATDLRNYES